jgi:hypothetical protein
LQLQTTASFHGRKSQPFRWYTMSHTVSVWTWTLTQNIVSWTSKEYKTNAKDHNRTSCNPFHLVINSKSKLLTEPLATSSAKNH